jgi:hypothetical protein
MSLRNIAQSIMTNNQVFDLLVHPEENSTYNLQFRAPQFQCTVSQTNGSIPLAWHPSDSSGFGSFSTLVFASEWPSDAGRNLLFSVVQHTVHNITLTRGPENTTRYEAGVVTVEQLCKPISMLYNADISFPRGVRKIKHSLSDARALPNAAELYNGSYCDVVPYGGCEHDGLFLKVPAEPQAYEDWHEKVREAFPIANEWALLDALGHLLEVKSDTSLLPPDPESEDCEEVYNLQSGETVLHCINWWRPFTGNTIGKYRVSNC